MFVISDRGVRRFTLETRCPCVLRKVWLAKKFLSRNCQIAALESDFEESALGLSSGASARVRVAGR